MGLNGVSLSTRRHQMGPSANGWIDRLFLYLTFWYLELGSRPSRLSGDAFNGGLFFLTVTNCLINVYESLGGYLLSPTYVASRGIHEAAEWWDDGGSFVSALSASKSLSMVVHLGSCIVCNSFVPEEEFSKV